MTAFDPKRTLEYVNYYFSYPISIRVHSGTNYLKTVFAITKIIQKIINNWVNQLIQQ